MSVKCRAMRLGKWLLCTVVLLVLAVWLLAWGRMALVETVTPEGGTSQGRWVQAMDVKLHVQEYGDAKAPPLVLVGGTGAWAQTWVSNVEAMVQAGYHVVAVDLPPFGYTTRPEPADYSRPMQAKRLGALIESLQLGSVTLLGHSYGGGPAAELAMQRPERIRHLILVDAAIGLREEVDTTQAPGLALRALGIRPLRTAFIALVATRSGFIQERLKQFVYKTEVATPERTALYTEPFKVRGFSAALGDWAFQFASENGQSQSERPEGFRRLAMPVDLIWGAEDQITPLAQAHALKALMPQSRLLVLPGVGHIPLIEDVALFNRSLTGVLQRP